MDTNAERNQRYRELHKDDPEYKARIKANARKHYLKYQERMKADSSRRQRDRRASYREQVIKKFSNGSMSCAKCGENRPYVLTVDHIHGGGKRHRKDIFSVTKNYTQVYSWLLKNGSLEDYQILCMNCQWEKRYKNKEYN